MGFPLSSTLLACGVLLWALPGRALGTATPPRLQAPRSERTDATLSPYFWVPNGNAAVDQLPLQSTTVKASILGVIADVKVTQVYTNQGQRPLEAAYVFPASTRAAVYGMKMTIGDRTIQARIRTKEQARQDYEEARQQGKSASLLEQHRPNVFQMNVANIMPGDEIRVELSYTELLVPTEGTYEFVYPTVVGPRYSNTPVSRATASEQWVANPYTQAGAAPLSTFDIQVRLAAGMPIGRMSCDTHRAVIAYDGPREALLKLDAAEGMGGNRDFILKYQLAGGQIQSGLLLTQGGDEKFFLLMMQPPKQVKAAQIPPREYVFILDVSGSMHGYPLETAKTLMRNLVGNLRPQDRFNLMAFEGAATLWSPSGSRPATAENLASALAFVGRQSGGGGTEILSALNKALALPHAPGMSRSFVIATDGYISVEPAVLDTVRKNLGKANLFAFGIGSSVNRYLIEGLAHAGMGEPFIVTQPDEAAPAAERLRQYIASPVLTGVKVAFKDFEAYDVEPLNLPDVLAERPVICFGKWKGPATGTIHLTGLGGTGAYHQSIPVANAHASDSSALRYLWARHRIQLLGDYGAMGDEGGQRSAITELGLKYGLLTNYTSFVAIDSMARNQGGTGETVTQPLPLPEGVPNSPLGGGQRAVAYLAPGLTQKSLPKRAGNLTGMRAAPTALDKCEVQASTHYTKEDLSTLPALHATPTTIRPGHITTDRSTNRLQALTRELAAKLNGNTLAALLRGLPKDCVLELHIDAAGRVLTATFNKAFPGSPKALALIHAWRFEGWMETGPTRLTVALRAE